MTPILCEISTVNFQERFFEVFDAIKTFVLEPPDSTPIGHGISRLNSQECHVEMLSAISGIVLGSSKFISVLRELDKLNDQIKNFAPQSVDLSPITRAITRLTSQDTHQELPDAFRNINAELSRVSENGRSKLSGCITTNAPGGGVGRASSPGVAEATQRLLPARHTHFINGFHVLGISSLTNTSRSRSRL